jgi:hypothetical protein
MQQIPVIGKLLFALFLMLVPLVNYAQTDAAKIYIPMKKGKINYEKAYIANKGINKAELYNRAEKWFQKVFPDQPGNSAANKETGEINGIGKFKIITSASGNYYWLRFNVDIVVSDTGYTFSTYNYYEKPIEPGITNDYSKIEYRWWDYRQGHPWSAEDEKLFTGLNSSTLTLMGSFKADMDQ